MYAVAEQQGEDSLAFRQAQQEMTEALLRADALQDLINHGELAPDVKDALGLVTDEDMREAGMRPYRLYKVPFRRLRRRDTYLKWTREWEPIDENDR